MRTRRLGLLGLLLVAACATLAIRASASSALRPSLAVVDAADSVHVILSWSPVRDARGEAVQHYVASVLDHGVVVASGTVTDTVFRAALAKVAGDSMVLTGEVYAVDARGKDGALGRTAPFTVVVPDPGPPAPSVRLDTIPLAYEPVMDSMRAFFPAGRFEGGTLVMHEGEELQGCVVAWLDGEAFRPAGQAPVCMQASYAHPTGLYRAPLRVHVLRLTE